MAFAAETARRAWRNARGKLVRKSADLIVVNEVGADKVFGADDNAAIVLGADGSHDRAARRAAKDDLADAVWDLGRRAAVTGRS